ncbi:hypothetical protein A3860_33715 [Niastella vici]|uniref:Uncharacterized protein n=1 Tax=Niastella vici TaxID=1703345 RepID=A0A1V9FPP7_9BACT|nr:hypothetical protein [Niastella vici]OQP60339.1 hypothetical protein A3860_33715 [Niastella vici]
MSIKTMTDLLKKQEAERQDFAIGVYDEWQLFRKMEQELLSPYDGAYESAPTSVQQKIAQAREDYFAEWGSDGRLAALMEARHNKEREKLAERQNIAEQLQTRKKQNDRGR